MPGASASRSALSRTELAGTVGALSVVAVVAAVLLLTLASSSPYSTQLAPSPARANGPEGILGAPSSGPPPAANNTTVDVTMAFNLSINASAVLLAAGHTDEPWNNTTNYTFVWFGLPPGCPTGAANTNFSVLNCTATAEGSYSVYVNVTDYVTTNSSNSGALALRVNPVPTLISFQVTRTNLTLGTTIWFNATGSGGTGAISFAYTGLPLGTGCSGNSSSIQCTPDRAGTYNVTVAAVDSYGVASSPASVVVHVASGAKPSKGPGTTGWAIIGAILVIGALIVIALLVQARREERSARMAAEQLEPTPPAPPPAGGGPPSSGPGT